MDVNKLELAYSKLQGKREQLEKQYADVRVSLERNQQLKKTIDKALAVLGELADSARQDFKLEVDTLVTTAIRSVFSENFVFDLQMTTEGGRLKCTPVIWEIVGEEKIEFTPRDEMGGSILDPIGFALRVVLHQMQKTPIRPIFILDEPMKYIGHGELLDQAGKMFAEISKSLDLQLIIITHEPELASIADSVWQIKRQRGQSTANIHEKSC